jgi:outer membrane translocation and assembly module TamA
MFGLTGELQFPIVDPVHGVLFLDAGDTWNSLYDATLTSLKFGAGVGVTLEIPMLGPIGFYYAYGSETRKWMTHFAFGTQL